MPDFASTARGPSRLRPLLALVLVGFVVAPASAAEAPDDDPPKVVSVSPADGATDVPVETDIRIRFDRSMSPTEAFLSWRDWKEYHRPLGPMRYDAEAREFVLPVLLKAEVKHELALNPADGDPGRCKGFRAVDGPCAKDFRWSFTTAAPKPITQGATPPRVVSVSPAPGSEVGGLTLVEVAFDRPMDPACYGMAQLPIPLGTGRSQPWLRESVEARYDAAKRQFSLVIPLLQLWDGGGVRLLGFRSAEGVPADPIVLDYRSGRERLSPALRDRVEKSAASPKLREVVERAREASRKVESATIRVVAVNPTRQPSAVNFSGGYDSWGATFRKAPSGRFTAEGRKTHFAPVRVGSDGTTCWAVDLSNDQGVAVPAATVRQQVGMIDPFEAAGKSSADEFIRYRMLEYVGEVDVNGRRCHELHAWARTFNFYETVRWYLDAETYLPVRVQPGPARYFDFSYESINLPIPDDVFHPPAGIRAAEGSGPLPEGFRECQIYVNDGSIGNPAVSLTLIGAKGRHSWYGSSR